MRRATQNKCFLGIGVVSSVVAIYLIGQMVLASRSKQPTAPLTPLVKVAAIPSPKFMSTSQSAPAISPSTAAIRESSTTTTAPVSTTMEENLDEDFKKQREFHTRMMLQYGDATLKPGESGCKMPDLKVDDPVFNDYFRKNVTISCKEHDWVYAWTGMLFFDVQAVADNGPFTCTCKAVIRKDDHSNTLGEPYSCGDRSKLTTDFTDVYCKGKLDTQYATVLSTTVRKDDVVNRIAEKGQGVKEHLSVLMLALDSVSRLAMVRKMPKTVEYFKSLGGIFLERYNIVGDGTPQALLPMLCGKTEVELPNTRKRNFPRSHYCDVYPFIWKEFANKGYVTLEAQESVYTGTYQYRLNGFKQQPTDHYQRNYFIQGSKANHIKGHCIHGRPEYQVQFNYSLDLFESYPEAKKFGFTISDLCHDEINTCGAADDYFVWLLKELSNKGHLQKTVVMLFADHGARFSTSFTSFRNTQQGKLEERLPTFGILLPKWFKTKYQDAYKNFETNVNGRLLTPFNIYGSLRTILDNSFDKPKTEMDINKRDVSIFDPIPMERSCKNADVEPHWCACLNWENVPFDDKILTAVVQEFIDTFNNETRRAGELCHILEVDKIMAAQKYTPNKAVMEFKKANDKDGFIADFSDKVKVDMILYQLKLQTKPGGAIYEASVGWNLLTEKAEVDLRQLSILTKYSDNAKCITNIDSLSYLRLYCVCKS